MHSLNNHTETFMGNEDGNPKEIHLLRHGLVKEFKKLYKDHIGKSTSYGKPILNGFKSPEILMSDEYISNMERYFPTTDFIVSTRHPVLHFESMYNFKFRSQKFSGVRPDPLTLIGDCLHDDPDERFGNVRGVCTIKSFFHYGLSRIMITPMNTREEMELLDYNDWTRHPGYVGNVFITELGQIGDVNITRKAEYTNGLESFLRLTPNSLFWKPRNGNRTKERFIDICDERFSPLRGLLIDAGLKASKWIRLYLLDSPRVFVSNREHFLQLINQWQFDPCST